MDTCVPELLTTALLACHACATSGAVPAPMLVMTTVATRWLLPPPIAAVVAAVRPRVAPAAASPLGRGRVRGAAIDAPRAPRILYAPVMWTLWRQEAGGLSLQLGGRGLRGVWQVPAQDQR